MKYMFSASTQSREGLRTCEEAAKQSLGAESVRVSQSGTGGIGVLTETGAV